MASPRTELWKKVKGNTPPPEQAAQMDPNLAWVQSWQVPGGRMIFNHLTAALKLDLSSLANLRTATVFFLPLFPECLFLGTEMQGS